MKEMYSQFEEEMRLEIHKNIPGRKSKVSESESPGFNDDRIRGE